MAGAQKQRSVVQYQRFNPQSLLPQGLLAVSRSRGEVERSIAANFDALARQVGAMADRQAGDEGARAGKIEGAKDGFQPTRSSTIRGRAYDQNGTRTFMQKLDSDVRQDMQKVYENFREDPLGLTGALDALHKEYRKKHIFPEIEGDFDAGFSKLSTAYRNEAIRTADVKRRQVDQAASVERLNNYETERARVIEGALPGSPDAEKIIASSLAASEREIDDAVADGRMTPVQAEQAKQNARREVAVSWYSNQAKNFTTPTEVANYRKQLGKDFAAGKLKGVDDNAWGAIKRQLQQAERTADSADRKAAASLRQRGNRIAKSIALGIQPAPGEINQLIQDGKTSGDGGKVIEIAKNKIDLAHFINNSTLTDSGKLIADMRNAVRGGASAAELEVLQFAESAYAQLRDAVQRDPLGAAESRGVVERNTPLTIVQGKTADEYAGEISARVLSAKAAGEFFGVPAKIMHPGEAKMIEDHIRANPDDAGPIIEGLIRGAEIDAGALIKEFGKNGPLVAMIGAAKLSGADDRTAGDIMRGASKDAAGNNRPSIKSQTRSKIQVETYGDAFIHQPGDGTRMAAAAHNIARARIADSNIDVNDSEAVKEIFQAALQEVAGANFVGDVQYGGLTDYSVSTGWITSRTMRIVVPDNVRVDRFDDVIDEINVNDLAHLQNPPLMPDGKSYQPEHFKSAIPVKVKGGYRFATGDPASNAPGWLQGLDGAPYVLDFNDLERLIRPRLPEAFK